MRWEEDALVDGQLVLLVDEGRRRGSAGLCHEVDGGFVEEAGVAVEDAVF